jgi:hypothetical protein
MLIQTCRGGGGEERDACACTRRHQAFALAPVRRGRFKVGEVLILEKTPATAPPRPPPPRWVSIPRAPGPFAAATAASLAAVLAALAARDEVAAAFSFVVMALAVSRHWCAATSTPRHLCATRCKGC